MKLYRGDKSTKPKLEVGVWLTPDMDAAEFYADTLHIYDYDGKILDITSLGVGDDESRCDLVEKLEEEGIENAEKFRVGWEELYQLAEKSEFQTAVSAAGFDAVAVMQWNYDYSDTPYEAVMVCK